MQELNVNASSKKGISKAKFRSEDDLRLQQLVTQYGDRNWRFISSLMGNRSPRQCRERWENYINPYLNKAPWTEEEDRLLEEKIKEYGQKWRTIVSYFHGRSKNSLKNRWFNIQKKVIPENEVIEPKKIDLENKINPILKPEEIVCNILENSRKNLDISWVHTLDKVTDMDSLAFMWY